jgi:hypothetical protein
MIRKPVLAVCLGLALGGCGDEDDEAVRTEPVALDKLPPGALDTAKKTLPDVKFDRAWKAKFKGQDAIEIQGKNKQGKIREVEVDLTGKVLEVE